MSGTRGLPPSPLPPAPERPKGRRWDVRIFLGTPTEVAQQVMGHLEDVEPQQIHTVHGEALLMLSCGGPVDGQLAVTVCAFVDGKI